MKRTIITLIGVAALALVVTGCGTESSVEPISVVPVGLTVEFDLETPNGTVPGDVDIEYNSRPSGGPDSITVESGLVMLRTIRLHETPVSVVDTNVTAADEDRDMTDGSVRYHGPAIAQIGHTGFDIGTINVPVGNYQQLTFVLQKARATDDLGNHDDLLGSSVRVEGKVWNGSVGRSFVFETDYTSQIAVDGKFTVSEEMSDNLSLVFEAGEWFHNGSQWLDPDDPADRSQIVRSLRRNISGGVAVN
ncbi:MAG: hypothetical protein GF341_07190 [candidate division Zixibacteria bacterium]|nr:hypothetical protein [candidate division Zixibacteria bacterium]